MASLRDYFESAFPRVLWVGNKWNLENGTSTVEVTGRMYLDFNSGTKYLSFYLPRCADPPGACLSIVSERDRFLNDLNAVGVQSALPGEEAMNSTDRKFSGRIYLYCEADLPSDVGEHFMACASNGLSIYHRGPTFRDARSSLERPHVGVEARLEDAYELIVARRHEGALLSTLVAVAATSRARHPRPLRDDEAFERFVSEQLPQISSVQTVTFEIDGKTHSLGYVLYKWLRCALIHEGQLPAGVRFVPDPAPGRLTLNLISPDPLQLEFSYTLVVMLADMVARAAENASLPQGLRDSFISMLPWEVSVPPGGAIDPLASGRPANLRR